MAIDIELKGAFKNTTPQGPTSHHLRWHEKKSTIPDPTRKGLKFPISWKYARQNQSRGIGKREKEKGVIGRIDLGKDMHDMLTRPFLTGPTRVASGFRSCGFSFELSSHGLNVPSVPTIEWELDWKLVEMCQSSTEKLNPPLPILWTPFVSSICARAQAKCDLFPAWGVSKVDRWIG